MKFLGFLQRMKDWESATLEYHAQRNLLKRTIQTSCRWMLTPCRIVLDEHDSFTEDKKTGKRILWN